MGRNEEERIKMMEGRTEDSGWKKFIRRVWAGAHYISCFTGIIPAMRALCGASCICVPLPDWVISKQIYLDELRAKAFVKHDEKHEEHEFSQTVDMTPQVSLPELK